ncbi:TPA: hypothetical protein R5B02_001599 [Campylobacter jejuni]|nr:hypothetical protein [Campylobacter jejuni]
MQIGIFGVLLIIFIVLKILDLIDWSWWLVLSPFWFPYSVLLIFAILVNILYTKVKK